MTYHTGYKEGIWIKERDLTKYPDIITQRREKIECDFVISLWKDPSYIGSYKHLVAGQDIVTPDGMFYYNIARGIANLNYQMFDNITVNTYLDDKPTVKDGFIKRGGYKTVQEIMSLLNIANIDSYYDELVKNNALMDLYDAGFAVVENWDKFSGMTSTEVYDYMEYQLNNIFASKTGNIKVEDLSDGYDKYVEEWNRGVMRGFTIGYPMLNYRLAGVHKKNLLLHLAHIGNGKTTSSILFYILPAIEHGENVCIIANEQGVEEFRQMILSTVLFNRINYRKINRQRFIQGGFSPDDLVHIKLAQQWLKEKEGRIMFVETNDYSVSNVRKVIRKYSRIGYGLFVFDTLKPEIENSTTAWQDFSEVSKELFMIAKKEDVAIIATAQLSGESMSRRYLDLSCVGKSKAIAETATQVVMFRTLSADEKTNMSVYVHKKDPTTGKFMNVKEQIKLDPDKDYIVLFTPKNRFGDTKPQIVYERNMAWNSLREIGLTEINYDGFGMRR